MMNILKEMAIYVIFLYLLLMVGYGNRDFWAHYMYQNVKNLIAKGQWAQGGIDMENVSCPPACPSDRHGFQTY